MIIKKKYAQYNRFYAIIADDTGFTNEYCSPIDLTDEQWFSLVQAFLDATALQQQQQEQQEPTGSE